MSFIPSAFINSVAAIGIPVQNEKSNSNPSETVSWIGTGFFVGRRVSGNQYRPFLVTNKHVLNGQETILLRFKKRGSNELIPFKISLSSSNSVFPLKEHPDPNVDVAAVGILGGIIDFLKLDFNMIDIDNNSITSQEMRKNGIDEGSLVYMLGFPMGFVNEKSLLPICRLGCIARLSEEQIKENGSILVDIQTFPGNSGSPLFTKPEVTSLTGIEAYNKCSLFGIVNSHIPYTEYLMNMQTKDIVESRTENSGLSNVIPVEKIKEVIDLFIPRPDVETKA